MGLVSALLRHFALERKMKFDIVTSGHDIESIFTVISYYEISKSTVTDKTEARTERVKKTP